MDDLELEGQVQWKLVVVLNGPICVVYGKHLRNGAGEPGSYHLACVPPAHASRGKVVITLSMSHMGTRRLGAVWGWLTMGCLGRLVAACLVSPLSRKLSRV